MRQILLVVTLLHGPCIWATEAITPEQPPLTACAFLESPWAYSDESGALAGIAVDLHAYFQRATGRVIRTEPCTVKWAGTRLKEGSVDLALLPEAEGLSQWAEPLIPAYRARAMALPRKGVPVQRYEDLHGLTIAAPEGVDFNPRLQADPRVHMLWVASAADALELLVGGRADAVVGNANFYRFAASREGLDPNELFGPPFQLGERIVWVYISRKTDAPQFAAKLQAAFSEVSLENMIRQLRDHYYQRAISRH
ncbi:MAG: transporter substrate-binding domain-containing protein [Pseudomonadales bacterium]